MFFRRKWIILVIVLLLYISLCQSADIGKYFIKTPQSLVAPPGDRVTFECESNIPAEQVRWKLNGRFLHPLNESDVRISGNFLIVKVSKNRERFMHQVGDYQCVVEFGAEALTSVPAQLTIAHIDPFPPERTNQSLAVVDGNTVAISCDPPYSNPVPIVQFYKDGRALEPETSNSLVTDSGVLHLYNVSSADSGYYWCSSTNHITSETYVSPAGTIVSVRPKNTFPRKPPEFLITPKPYFVVPQDGNVTLECVAVGNPPPFTAWRKLRSPAMTNYQSSKGNLHLFNIGFQQEGEYICEAFNGVGIGDKSVTTLATVVLNSMPNITREPQSLVVEEGGEAIIDCSTEGLPKPRVYWVFNGHNVHDDGNIQITDSGLRIANVGKKHAGLFQCFATNPVGTVTSPAELKVLPKQITAGGMSLSSSSSLANDDNTDHHEDRRPTGTGTTPGRRHHNHKNNSKFLRRKHNKDRKGHKGEDMIPPSKPSMNRVSDDSVMVRWTVPPNSGYPIQFFKIQYKEMSKRDSRWMTIDDDIPPHIHSYEVGDLRVGHTYRFRIAAVYSNNDNKVGPNSDKFQLQKDNTMRRPNFIPMVTTAAPHNTTAIVLRWKQMSNSESGSSVDGYFIYYRESTSAGEYSKATVLGSDVDTYYIGHLKSGTAYDIKIQAFNKAGGSNFSSINTAKTLGTSADAEDEKGDDYDLRKKEHEFIVPDDPPPSSSEQWYMILGAIVAGFWVFLCIGCGVCYKCKNRKVEEEAKYPCDLPIDLDPKHLPHGHVTINGHTQHLNGYIPTIASHLELDHKETSFVERHNNNRPISPSQLNSVGQFDLTELESFNHQHHNHKSVSDMNFWTEMKPLHTHTTNLANNSNSRNNSLHRKKNLNNTTGGNCGSLRSTNRTNNAYISCSNDELDIDDHNINSNNSTNTKIFPKEHYRSSRKHSLSRSLKRNSMGDG